MPCVLIVEDSKTFAYLAKKSIESELRYDTKLVSTYAEAKKMIEEEQINFFAALVDLVLPDASNGEIVDLMCSKKIPTIVFTGSLSEDIREKVLSKGVIDYIIKKNVHDLYYIIQLIQRIKKNQSIGILVADDSSTSRHHIKYLLETQRFNVLEASNGQQALELLNAHPDIKMVITDYIMPKINGCKLASHIRKKYDRDELSIIGISSHEASTLSAKFLKSGANDYLCRPFLNEEFFCRVMQNIELVERIQTIKDLSNRDYLTNLYNRRYFFEVGEKIYENAQRGNITLVVAMIDIDFFKKINDTYGHSVGDAALKHVAALLLKNFRGCDIVARLGGEEFCVLAADMDQKKAFWKFELFRRLIEQSKVKLKGKAIKLTVSMGVSTNLKDSLEEMVNYADGMLYRAKEEGRNRVVIGS